MAVARRSFLGGGLALAMLGEVAVAAPEASAMYGMIGKMKAKPGQRAALAAILGEGTGTMPGCRNYIVAEDRVFEWIQVGAFAVAAVGCGAVAVLVRRVSGAARTACCSPVRGWALHYLFR